MAALAPMPSASVRTTVTLNPLARISERTACFISPKKAVIKFIVAPALCRTDDREIDTVQLFFWVGQAVSSASTTLITFVRLSQQLSQPVQPAFPRRAAIGDPLLGCGKAAGFDPASAYPPGLFG